jgi:hypothetical protein
MVEQIIGARTPAPERRFGATFRAPPRIGCLLSRTADPLISEEPPIRIDVTRHDLLIALYVRNDGVADVFLASGGLCTILH